MFLKELNNLEDKAQFIIGYFERKDDVEYENFRKVASNVKEIVAYTSMIQQFHDFFEFGPIERRLRKKDITTKFEWVTTNMLFSNFL